MNRKVIKVVKGQRAIDGEGVHLVRVLGPDTIDDFDPFLMLDSFDSTNPSDYTKGFPMHPHRGIETVTYLVKGEIDHRDSLGNRGKITDGESQWMTAGSGILHEEMPRPSERMLGYQLWINLPKVDKMTEPNYFDINDSVYAIHSEDDFTVKVLSGKYDDTVGAEVKYIQATIYDINLNPNVELEIPTKSGENVFVFLLEGDGIIDGIKYDEKSAILFGNGDSIKISSTENKKLNFGFFSAPRLNERVAWGGPIVMNTRDELNQAFRDLENGTFIK
ncbi:MAG: pirin family protein [Tissierellia bacterium]|nr:pirin family protein [Tissierellia bacterium]